MLALVIITGRDKRIKGGQWLSLFFNKTFTRVNISKVQNFVLCLRLTYELGEMVARLKI